MVATIECACEDVRPVGTDRSELIATHINVVFHTEILAEECAAVRIGQRRSCAIKVGDFCHLITEEDKVVASLNQIRTCFSTFTLKFGHAE